MTDSPSSPQIRPIRSEDDAALAAIIREVMPEFGAGGEGFAIHDPEVDFLSRAYSEPGAAYFVVEEQGKVIGGAGYAQLECGDRDLCELRKMYFLPEARHRGLGRQMLGTVLLAAREAGYRRCYLETLDGMDAAQRLYENFGFRPLASPLGDTGHHGCDTWMILDLGPLT